MKTVIVGCGTIANVHSKCLSQMDNCNLAAFADIKKERAESFAERFGGNAYRSLEEMLECEKPDVLHICTPHYLHVPMAVYALSQGIHVFMEKPPVISKEQHDALKEAVAGSKARLGICYQNRYNQCVKYAKNLIESGEAGKLLGARGLVTWHRNEPYYTESGWRGSWKTEGGGALINQSIHTLDLLLYFLGKPTWVDASMSNHHLKDVIEVEDTMEAFVRFGDATANFYATTSYCTDVPPLIEFECENIRIRMEDPALTLYYKDGRVVKPEFDARPTYGKVCYGSSHAVCIADFYDCVETGRHFPQELSDMEDSIRLTLGVYESAKTGKPVDLT